MSLNLAGDAAGGMAPVAVLIVDDSVVARAVLARIVGDDPRCTVVAAVAGAGEALAVLSRQRVDVVLLDLELPGVDGLSALPDLIAAAGGARFLVVSSSCGEGASATIQALALGAADTLAKPGAAGLAGRFSELLRDKIARLAEGAPAAAAAATPRPHDARVRPHDLLAIGASTGGIHALSRLLRRLPPDYRQPIVITQHLPLSFTPYFAAQVAVLAGRPCDVAVDGGRIEPGRVVIAPGNAHLRVDTRAGGGLAARLARAVEPSGCLPAVDPMFVSAADAVGPRLVAAVLSGMGRDGTAGARAVRAAGGTVIAQDQASSAVWGMPGSVVNAGMADMVMTPEAIGAAIGGEPLAPVAAAELRA